MRVEEERREAEGERIGRARTLVGGRIGGGGGWRGRPRMVMAGS